MAAMTKWQAISKCCLRVVILAFIFEIIIFTFISRLGGGAYILISITITFKCILLLCKIACYSESESIYLCLHPSTQPILCEPITSGTMLGIWDAVMDKYGTSPSPPKLTVNGGDRC